MALSDSMQNALSPPSPKGCGIAMVGNAKVGKSWLFEKLCAVEKISAKFGWQSFARGTLCFGVERLLQNRLLFSGPCVGCGNQPGAPCKPGVFGHSMAKPKPQSARSSREATPLELVDVPGISSLFAAGELETWTRELLFGHVQGLVVVLDANNLRRSLAMALEASMFELPMALILNVDGSNAQNKIHIDDCTLEKSLQMPLARVTKPSGRGLGRLPDLLHHLQAPKPLVHFSRHVEDALHALGSLLSKAPISSKAMGLLLLLEDSFAVDWANANLNKDVLARMESVLKVARSSSLLPLRASIANAFYAAADRILDQVVWQSKQEPNLLAKVGHAAQHPVFGPMIAACVLCLAYVWIGVFAATFLVDAINKHFFGSILLPLVQSWVALVPSAFVQGAILDPNFGLLPTGLFLALGIVMPVLFAFYFFYGLLDDSGYLARLAIVFDRWFRQLGLNGQALVPLVLGFSCITMAVLTTRMLPSNKERIILTLLLCMGIPCAPLLSVMIVILGAMPWTAAAVIFGIIATQIFVAGFVASRLIKGTLPDLILEIPSMRVPRLAHVLSNTWHKTWAFGKEAIPIFLLASFVVFLFHWFGGLGMMEELARPVTRGILGLPDQAVQVFIKTAIRRENGATELNLLKNSFDNVQLVVAMLVMTFLIPCVNACIVMLKERGLATTFFIVLTASSWALVVGGVLHVVCRSLGITFS